MRRVQGFTLIEVLAAVFLTALVMTVAITFFVDLSDATDAATHKARRGRQALAVVDRVARDMEAAYLRAKPDDVDPLYHPWFFVATSTAGDDGASRVQLITRNHRPRNALDHGADVALVTWMLEPAENGPGYELLRAVEPGLPRGQPGEFLSADDERFMLVAEGVESFSMRFMGEEREWLEEWDSSLLEQSSQLPRAAEIQIAYLDELRAARSDFDDFGFGEEPSDPERYVRHVLIPMRPVDVDAILEDHLAAIDGQQPSNDDPDEDEDGADPSESDGQEQCPDGQILDRQTGECVPFNP